MEENDFAKQSWKRLDEVSKWIEQYKQFWASRLDNLEDFLGEMQQKRRNLQKKRKRKQ